MADASATSKKRKMNLGNAETSTQSTTAQGSASSATIEGDASSTTAEITRMPPGFSSRYSWSEEPVKVRFLLPERASAKERLCFLPKARLQHFSTLLASKIKNMQTKGLDAITLNLEEMLAKFHYFTYPPYFFDLFVTFILSGSIVDHQCLQQQFLISDAPYDQIWDVLRAAWILGCRLHSRAFRDAVIDAMTARLAIEKTPSVDERYDEHSSFMCSQVLDLAYSKRCYICRDCPLVCPYDDEKLNLRRLVADAAAWNWQAEIFEEVATDDHGFEYQEFLQDVLVKLASIRDMKRSGELSEFSDPGCLYHEHGLDELCYKKSFEY